MTQNTGREAHPELWQELDATVDDHVKAAEEVQRAARSGNLQEIEKALMGEVGANDRYAAALRALGLSPSFAMRTSGG